MPICNYGCGQEATYQLKNGKWCCSETHRQCNAIVKKRVISNTGKKRSIEVIEKMKNYVPWNKGKTYSEETKQKMKGKIPWNKNKTNVYSEETISKIKEARKKQYPSMKGKTHSEEAKRKMSLAKKHTLEQISKKYPFFSKVEDLRYNPDNPVEIQCHCKNHNCQNSKEKGGWFTPTYIQFYERIRQIENENGNGGSYLYCSDNCKHECPLYNLIHDPLITKKEVPYTKTEYQIFRQEVLNRANNLCEYCNKEANIVHHSRPQKLEPTFVLDPDFGISCCKECHYKYGHETGTECSTGSLANKKCI